MLTTGIVTIILNVLCFVHSILQLDHISMLREAWVIAEGLMAAALISFTVMLHLRVGCKRNRQRQIMMGLPAMSGGRSGVVASAPTAASV
jgi:hypothetical protein